MLVFTHIPRTGGTSLRHFVAARMTNCKHIDGFTDFAFMSDAELNSYDFVATHCGYGLFSRIQKQSEKIVILRDPVERVVSAYYYLRDLPEYVSYASHYAKTMDLVDFAMEKNPAVNIAVDNVQTWHLIQDKNLPFRQRHAQLAEAEKITLALEHLAEYTFVGFYTDLVALFEKICAYYSWPLEALPWLARSTRPSMQEIDSTVLEKIRSKVDLDSAVYAEAVLSYGVSPRRTVWPSE